MLALFSFNESISEFFTNTALGEEIVQESGVCQNCFIKFNEYDEHQTLAETIQLELVALMDNKIIALDEETPEENLIKKEVIEEVSIDPIDYEPYESEEMFMPNDDQEEQEVEAIHEDYGHYEIIVDDTKENVKMLSRNLLAKSRASGEYIVLDMDGNQKAYQCDICFKAFKDKSKLRTHREIHTDKRNVICPVSRKAQPYQLT